MCVFFKEMFVVCFVEFCKLMVFDYFEDGGLFICEDMVVISSNFGELSIREDIECLLKLVLMMVMFVLNVFWFVWCFFGLWLMLNIEFWEFILRILSMKKRSAFA